MKPHPALVPLCLLLLASGARHAAAQPLPAPIERSWMSAWPPGPPAAGFAPALWFDGQQVGYGIEGIAAFGLGARDGPSDAAAQSRWNAPAPHAGALLELGARGSGTGSWSDSRSGAVSMRLHYAGERAGAWLATGGLAPGEDQRLPLAGGGVWMRRGDLTFTTQVVQLLRAIHVVGAVPRAEEEPDSLVLRVPDRMYPDDDVRVLTGVEVGLGWSGAWIDLDGRVGAARGPHPPLATWAELRAAYRFAPGVDVFASVRTVAHVADVLESVQGNRAVVGIQFGRSRSPAAPARKRTSDGVSVEPVGPAAVRLGLALRARTLEVSCDANGWTAVPAVEVARDRWEVVLPIGAGLHRIAIRTNGGDWRAPPGLPKVQDDFGGEVGLLVVP